MALFSSRRERRLWLWTAAVVAAIYATLGLSRSFAGVLREQFEPILFIVCMALVGATIAARCLKVRPGGVEIVITLGVLATYLLAFARIVSPEERTHLIEYGVVGVFIHAALSERTSQGRHVPVPAVLAVALTAALGLLDECIQAFLPNRYFDPRDIMVNALAGTFAVSASVSLMWAQQKYENLRRRSN